MTTDAKTSGPWRKARVCPVYWVGGKGKAVPMDGWTDGLFDYCQNSVTGFWAAIHPETGLSIAGTFPTREQAQAAALTAWPQKEKNS